MRCASPRRAPGSAFIYPARHQASSSADPSLPAMGQRLRLKRGFADHPLPAPGPGRSARAEALRDDPGRQRLALVRVRGAEPGLGQRRPPLPPGRARKRLRGRGHRASSSPTALRPREGRAGRLLGLELRRLARAAVPGGSGEDALARALRRGVRHRRGELDLLPPPLARCRGPLGRADALRLPLRRQGEPLPHARPPAAGRGGGHRANERAPGAARGRRQARARSCGSSRPTFAATTSGSRDCSRYWAAGATASSSATRAGSTTTCTRGCGTPAWRW